MQIEQVPLSQLETWPGHARRGYVAVDDLVASIKAEGLLQPLIVTKNGKGSYQVVAGNRRLRALEQIIQDQATAVPGTLVHQPPIPCHVLPDGLDHDKLLEISLAENTQRLDMHPMDECEAFAKLAGKGKDLPGIAKAFDVSERFVKQRLVLATLPDKAREAFRKGEIDYDGAVALARLGDAKLIAKAMKVGKNWNGNYENAAGQLMRDDKRFYVKHARFETAPNYKTSEDMFDVDGKDQPAGPYFVKYSEAMTEQAAWLRDHMLALAKDDSHAFVDLRPLDGFYTAYRSAEDGETKGVGMVCWIEPSGEVKEQRAVSLKSERQQEAKKIKLDKKAAVTKKAAKGEKIHAGEVSRAFADDVQALHLLALMRFLAGDPVELAKEVRDLVTINRVHLPVHEEIKKLHAEICSELDDNHSLAGVLATYIQPMSIASSLKKHKAALDLGSIAWPKMMLMRLPAVMLAAEMKALKLKLDTKASKRELVELIWKHKPENWVPQYARL